MVGFVGLGMEVSGPGNLSAALAGAKLEIVPLRPLLPLSKSADGAVCTEEPPSTTDPLCSKINAVRFHRLSLFYHVRVS